MAFADIYRGLPVLVTGHTGFKGSWLCEWLLQLGAKVTGFALDPQPHEILFDQLNLRDRVDHDVRGDVRDLQSLQNCLADTAPKVVFHLAAQPLVRLSYTIPVETFEVNVLGTVNVLEAVRRVDAACSVICVTTDKCYENREWVHSYREEDAMGGHDPYSASKGCAELAIAAYRRSYFEHNSKVLLASARAGNVIGGGDWALDRIVPDCFRAIHSGQPIVVRNRIATRPWQHVLEPLSGYLWLAALLNGRIPVPIPPTTLTGAFNFGPSLASNRTVEELVTAILDHIPGSWIDASNSSNAHEATKLNLSIDKAFHTLNWTPTWDFEQTISQTASWYASVHRGTNPLEKTQSQIAAFTAQAATLEMDWAK